VPRGLNRSGSASILATAIARSTPAAGLRNGLTTLETAGYATGSLVLHPLDWKDVELARASNKRRRALELAQAAGGALLD
jgi:hypothetical protein